MPTIEDRIQESRFKAHQNIFSDREMLKLEIAKYLRTSKNRPNMRRNSAINIFWNNDKSASKIQPTIAKISVDDLNSPKALIEEHLIKHIDLNIEFRYWNRRE